jgi:hypothetical protein
MLKYVKYVGLESAVSDPDSKSQHVPVALRVLQPPGSLYRASTFQNCKYS